MNLVSRLLFPAPTPSYTIESFPGELLLVPRSLNPQTSATEDLVPLLLLRHVGARFLFLVLHGNAEDLGRCRAFCAALRKELGVHVLAVEYPGYGVCPGNGCDERGATENADSALRFAREVLRWPAGHIVVLGRSVGTGPAVFLARKHAGLAGLVLVSPFVSVKEVCRETFGPVANLITERFPNLQRIPAVTAPCLVLHGQKDAMIPLRHGRLLYEACRSRKRFVSPADLDHNGNLIHNREHLFDPLTEFFDLPQYCSEDEELQVPNWATCWRPTPLPRAMRTDLTRPSGPGMPLRCRCLACTQPHCMTSALGCASGTCSAFQSENSLNRLALGPPNHVEATIAEAVEHILTVGYDDGDWVDATVCARREGGCVSPDSSTAEEELAPAAGAAPSPVRAPAAPAYRGSGLPPPPTTPISPRPLPPLSPTGQSEEALCDTPISARCTRPRRPPQVLPTGMVRQRPIFARG